MRFIHFRFGRDYMEYLNIAEEDAQKDFVNDRGKDTFVYMNSTLHFNLQSPEGRRAALCHILAILRWHDAQNIRQPAASAPRGDNNQSFSYSGESEEDRDYRLSDDDDSMDIEE